MGKRRGNCPKVWPICSVKLLWTIKNTLASRTSEDPVGLSSEEQVPSVRSVCLGPFSEWFAFRCFKTQVTRTHVRCNISENWYFYKMVWLVLLLQHDLVLRFHDAFGLKHPKQPSTHTVVFLQTVMSPNPCAPKISNGLWKGSLEDLQWLAVIFAMWLTKV